MMKNILGLFLLPLFSVSAFAQGNDAVFADKKNKIFYAKDCKEIAAISYSDMVVFPTVKEAEDKGFARAKACNEPAESPKASTPDAATPPAKTQPAKAPPKQIMFIGDSATKQMYKFGCAEIAKIKYEMWVALYSAEDAAQKGFVLSKNCSTVAQKKADKSKAEPREKLKPSRKAYNILAVKTYPESWTDRLVTIDGGIKLGDTRDAEDFGKERRSQVFYISDASGGMSVIAGENKQVEYLRNQIIYNDGNSVEGTFSFVISSEVYKNLGTIGVLKSFSLAR